MKTAEIQAYARDGAVFVRCFGLGDEAFASYKDALAGQRFSRYEKATHVDAAAWPTVEARLRAVATAPRTRFRVHESVSLALARSAERDARDAEERDARARDLYPYQREGVRWLASRRAALLADEMGLGKTAQLLAALPTGPALVVCPAVAIGTWIREIRRWRPDLIPWPVTRQGFEILKPPYVTLVSFDSLPDVTPPRGLTVVADEAHSLKSARAKRTRFFRLLSSRVLLRGGRVWLASGTPLENRPPELWAVLQAAQLAHEAFSPDLGGGAVVDAWARFREIFGAMPKGKRGTWGEVGGKRLFLPNPEGPDGDKGLVWCIASPAVRACLSRVMLRRTRAAVLPELPEKTYATLTATLSPAATRQCDTLEAAHLREGESAEDLHKRLSGDMSAVAELLETLSAAKIPSLLEHVEAFEEAGEPLVVFCPNRRPVEALRKRRGWGVVLGDDDASARAQTVERFQRGELVGIAGTIQALGVSVTLTRASKVLFVGRAWNPEKNRQAEDRVCRIGQDRGVTVYDLVSPHALDERIADVLRGKDTLIRSVFWTSTRCTPVGDSGLSDDAHALLARVRGGR
jgi:SWI/SNF-related matrix-associated actin-dependent regulator 1 of chromatin subfamily A